MGYIQGEKYTELVFHGSRFHLEDIKIRCSGIFIVCFFSIAVNLVRASKAHSREKRASFALFR